MAEDAYKKRLSLEQMAALARGGGPWTCPACGCRDTRIVESRYVINDSRFDGYAKRRVRVCRNCKAPAPDISGTLEVAIPEGHRIAIVPMPDDDAEDESRVRFA